MHPSFNLENQTVNLKIFRNAKKSDQMQKHLDKIKNELNIVLSSFLLKLK